jgi:hypothetical protein
MYGGTGQNSFKIPGLNASAANGSASRIPVGQHPGGPTEVNANGKSGGSLEHTHGPGSLAVNSHTHSVGTLAAPIHGHGHSLSAPAHWHRAREDIQSFAGNNGGSYDLVGNTVVNTGGPAGWPDGQDTSSVDPTTTGGISNASAITLTGSMTTDVATGTSSASRTLTGVSGSENPPFIAILWIIKL